MPPLYKYLQAITLSSALLAGTQAHAAGDADAGHLLYQARCAACHSVDFNGIGPAHRGVFGRLAGKAAGFDGYSLALKSSGLVWSEKNLELWLSDPERLVPGQKMGVNVTDSRARADLIAYLKSISEKK